MVKLLYPHDYRFVDRERDKTYDGRGVYDVPDDAKDQYLERGWEEPDDEDLLDASEAEVVVDGSDESTGPDPVAEADDLSDEATGDGDADEEQEQEQEQEQVVYEDLTVSEIEEALATREFSDDELREMLSFERENKDRKGAIEAIENELRDTSAATDAGAGDGDGDGDDETGG